MSVKKKGGTEESHCYFQVRSLLYVSKPIIRLPLTNFEICCSVGKLFRKRRSGCWMGARFTATNLVLQRTRQAWDQPSKTGRSCPKDETNNIGEPSLTRQSEVWGRECPSICAEEAHYYNREATKGRVGKWFCSCRCFVLFSLFHFFFKLFSVFWSSTLSLPQKIVNAFSTLTGRKESYSRD